jgi:histidinol-phosphate aminotransferase
MTTAPSGSSHTIQPLLRAHVRALKPYSTARDEFSGNARIFLDANENPYGDGLNRYPDPHHRALKQRISELKQIPVENIFLGNGSDEAIDLVLRATVNPDEGIVITPPTYGMYGVAGAAHGGRLISAPLRPDFSLDLNAIAAAAHQGAKVIFICSPNNPTGNQFDLAAIREVLEIFTGIVVVDEAYIDFAAGPSACSILSTSPRLVVLQTLSKAWGLAGIRVGMAFAHPELIVALNKLKLPYNINTLSQQTALHHLADTASYTRQVAEIISERARMIAALSALSCVLRVYPTEGNFILVRCARARELFSHLQAHGVIVRDRSRELHCDDCLRITVGTPAENDEVLKFLAGF